MTLFKDAGGISRHEPTPSQGTLDRPDHRDPAAGPTYDPNGGRSSHEEWARKRDAKLKLDEQLAQRDPPPTPFSDQSADERRLSALEARVIEQGVRIAQLEAALAESKPAKVGRISRHSPTDPGAA